MNIGVDVTSFGNKEIINKTLSLSTSIFTADLLDGFATLGKANQFTLLAKSAHVPFFRSRFPGYRTIPVKSLPFSIVSWLSGGKISGIRYIKKYGAYRRIAEKLGLDLLWFPYSVSYSVARTNIPTLFTVHDMFRFHKLGETEGLDLITSEKNRIVAISSYTKDDIVRSLEYGREIAVIPNSVRLDLSATHEIPGLSERSFILDLNAYVEKKNPMTLLKAFDLTKDRCPHTLVFAGGYRDKKLFAQMQDFIRERNLAPRVMMLYQIPQEERNWLLKNAALFVTPSLFEGFGRTPVEACIAKVPVISTKETSLHEATMGLATYVEDPCDENELAELMLEKLAHPESEERLDFVSRTLLNAYSAETCAKKYLDIFEEMTLRSDESTMRGGVLTRPLRGVPFHCLPEAA